MSKFPQKHFQGKIYTFEHLQPIALNLDMNIEGVKTEIKIFVTFGCHCFTENFNPEKHKADHIYRHQNETRAFDPARYECSKHLPKAIDSLLTGMIYRSDKSYTYVSQILIAVPSGSQSYSIFFSLERATKTPSLNLRMYIKSAYLSPLKSSKNAQKWRFKGLICEILEISQGDS